MNFLQAQVRLEAPIVGHKPAVGDDRADKCQIVSSLLQLRIWEIGDMTHDISANRLRDGVN